jgi:hypothetical protein
MKRFSTGHNSSSIPQRRAVRLNISHYTPAVYIGYLGRSKKVFPVSQIAELGAGFYPQHNDLSGDVGALRTLVLSIGDIMIPIRSRLVYVSDQLAGVEFLLSDEDTRLTIRSHFCQEYTAANLKPIHHYERTAGGVCHRMRFAEPNVYTIEIVFKGNSLCEVTAELDLAQTTIKWFANDPNRVFWHSDAGMDAFELRRQLLGLVHNLRGLEESARRKLDAVICQIRPL